MNQERVPFFTVSAPYDIAYRNSSTEHPVGPHTHNATELYLTLTPLPDVLLKNTVSKVPAGSLILIPPFCIHQLYHKADVKYERYILSVFKPWLEQLLFDNPAIFSRLSQGTDPLIIPICGNQLCELIQRLDVLLATAKPQTIESLQNFLRVMDLILALIQEKENLPNDKLQISGSQQKVNDIIAFIHTHLEEPLRIEGIASHFYLHPDYLARLFKKHTNTTIMEYITLLKINMAQAYLRDGQSISWVAEKLGYSSYAYFAKTFKRMTGITPGQQRLKDS